MSFLLAKFALVWLAMAGLLFLLPGNIQAIPTFSCIDSATCNGNEYAVYVTR